MSVYHLKVNHVFLVANVDILGDPSGADADAVASISQQSPVRMPRGEICRKLMDLGEILWEDDELPELSSLDGETSEDGSTNNRGPPGCSPRQND